MMSEEERKKKRLPTIKTVRTVFFVCFIVGSLVCLLLTLIIPTLFRYLFLSFQNGMFSVNNSNNNNKFIIITTLIGDD